MVEVEFVITLSYSISSMRLVYFTLYQLNLQFGLLVWDGLWHNNILNPLIINQSIVDRICLNIVSLQGPSIENY